jgi:hypothetical protein
VVGSRFPTWNGVDADHIGNGHSTPTLDGVDAAEVLDEYFNDTRDSPREPAVRLRSLPVSARHNEHISGAALRGAGSQGPANRPVAGPARD